MQLCPKEGATTGKSQNMTVSNIDPDRKVILRQKGMGGGTLRKNLWTRYAKIFRLDTTNKLKSEGRDFFKSHSLWPALDLWRFELAKSSEYMATRHPMSTMARTRAWVAEEMKLN